MILEALENAKKDSKKRKFSQTWDFSIILTGIDLKKPENRFSLEFSLPEGRGKDVKVAVIADAMAKEAKGIADIVINKQELEAMEKDKKKLKNIINQHDWFLAEAQLMPYIGKTFGAIFGPRGKLPKPIPPKAKLEPLVNAMKRSQRVVLKESPVVHIPVGTDSMPPEAVARNIEAAYSLVKDRLPKGKANIKTTLLKLTMGKPVKVEFK
jgi:large subunit ribosomal protein L1